MLGSGFMYPVFGFARFKGWLLSFSLWDLLSTKYQNQLIFTICQAYKAKNFMYISLFLQNRYYYYHQVYIISVEKLSDLLMVTTLVEQRMNVGFLFLCCGYFLCMVKLVMLFNQIPHFTYRKNKTQRVK